jgi:translation initiation factor IF-1
MDTGGRIRTAEGVIEAQLPRGLYRVEVEGNRRITAHAAGGARRNFVRLIAGDRVIVELAARDLTRGRVVKKL